MKGFEIQFKEETIRIAVEDGLATINIFDNNGDSKLYVGAINYKEQKDLIWHDYSSISIGEKLEIKATEFDYPSSPEKINERKDIKRPKSKLEVFLGLETDLKKRGIL